MNQLHEILNQFKPVTLQEMDAVKLMNRMDTKFILHHAQMADILSQLTHEYRILEISGKRQSRYETLYYDTEQFHHYLCHQNGKLNRYKVRKRNYVESGLSFLEVKFKTNKDRTIKKRVPLEVVYEGLNENDRVFVEERTGMGTMMEAKLWNRFQRITLVNDSSPERLTIDCFLEFETNENRISLDNLVIAEVKQESENRNSPFLNELKKRTIRPEGISKYCLGVTLLYPSIKHNRFKEKILRIKKVTNRYDSNAT